MGNSSRVSVRKHRDDEKSSTLLALAGRVPVKVVNENGAISSGDLLTTSSKPGYAMRCSEFSECTGAILGKALESLPESTKQGTILAQVQLR